MVGASSVAEGRDISEWGGGVTLACETAPSARTGLMPVYEVV